MRKSILSSAANAKRERERQVIRTIKQREDAKRYSDLSIELMQAAFDTQKQIEANYRAQHCKDLIDKIDKEMLERNAEIAKRWDARLRHMVHPLFRSLYDR